MSMETFERKILTHVNNMLKKKSEDLFHDTQKIAKQWKKDVRKLLSSVTRRIGFSGESGSGYFPRLDEGDLRRSLHYKVLKNKITRKNKVISQIESTIVTTWSDSPKGDGKNYGYFLNVSNIFKTVGWRDRTSEILKNRLAKKFG